MTAFMQKAKKLRSGIFGVQLFTAAEADSQIYPVSVGMVHSIRDSFIVPAGCPFFSKIPLTNRNASIIIVIT